MDGERLGAYLIEHELGSGGMGKVYAATVVGRARGLAAGNRVALKVVHPHLLETEGFFMRFMQEARIGASIQHENVVRTLSCETSDGLPSLVMEYFVGQMLTELLLDLGRVPASFRRRPRPSLGRREQRLDRGVAWIGLRQERGDLLPDVVDVQ